jgi:hypothetical protein
VGFERCSKALSARFYSGREGFTGMSKFLHPLLTMIASATEQELARHVQYLKEENRILQSKLPKRITVTPRHLSRFGKPVGAASRS